MRAAVLVFISFLYSQAACAESVPFETCAQSSTWMRPLPELQANKVWNDSRYTGFGKDAYAWTHDFLVLDEFMDVSGILAVINLSGLWTVKTQWLDKCYVNHEQSTSKWIQVVSLFHHVKEIQYDANTYTVVVEPTGKGFDWIFIRRLNGWGLLRFVTPEGKQLNVWDERAVPAWLTKATHPAIQK
jgi:hypothetical protein